MTEQIPIIDPNNIPISIERAFFFNKSICLYKGRAKATVDGPKTY